MAQGSSNPTADIKKIAGTNISVGAGNSDTGTQRVVLATNQSAIPVTGTFWQATQPVSGTVAATQSGTWNIGSITTLPTVTIAANSSVNLNQIAGTATATGNGVAGTGVQRVTIASDNTAFSVNANQAGTWNINNVSGTVSLPTGAATAANQSTVITSLQLLDDAVGTSGSAIATGMFRVGGTDGTNNRLLSVNTSGHVNIADGGNSITVDGTVTVGNASIPVTDNSGSLTVDAPVGTPVFVRISNGTAAVDTLPVSGTVSVNALPAGTNNIGDVDVLSIVPGTGATNLGKQTDSAAGATDTGVAILGIRDDVLTTLTPADGDYTRFRVNSVGRLWTSATIDAALPTGSNVIGGVTQSGTWNIGSITTLPSLPTGSNTIGAVNIAAGQTLGTVTTVGTVTTLSQFGGQAINLGAGTTGTGTLRVVEATGSTGTQTNPSVGTTSVTLLAANANRRAATIYNGSTSILYVRLSATAASTTTFTCKMQPDDYYEVPSQYNGAITGILNTGSSTLIQVTEIT